MQVGMQVPGNVGVCRGFRLVRTTRGRKLAYCATKRNPLPVCWCRAESRRRGANRPVRCSCPVRVASLDSGCRLGCKPGLVWDARDASVKRSTLKNGRGFAASPAQREKARTQPCIVTGARSDEGALIDPAHLCARAQGGCDAPECVLPLRRDVHNAFDQGRFDLLPYLIAQGRVTELQHALGHYRGDLISLLQRTTGTRWAPEREAAA